MDKRTALGVIEQALARLGELAGNGLDEGAMDTFQRTTSSDLRRVFGEGSDLHRQFEEIDWGPNRVLDVSDPEGTRRLIREGLERGARAARSVLDAALHEIGHWSEEETSQPAVDPNEAADVPSIDFIEDASMDAIVQSDLRELAGAVRHRLHKSAVLLCGSILEAVLIDVLDRRRDIASSYLKKKKFPDDASLDDLLLVASNEDLLSETARQVGIAVKDHRDLIHPHRQARERVAVDADTAQAMLVLLRLVVRDLRRAHDDGAVSAYRDK